MKINLINGSPKSGESNSGIILNRLSGLISASHKIKIYRAGVKPFTDEMGKDIVSGDIIILAFPLYWDSVPSHILKMFLELENIIKMQQRRDLIVYAIVNNGLYEGKQNHVAFEIIQHWCEHSEINFGGGIGQGAGEMLTATQNIPFAKGPFNNLFRALKMLAEKVALKESFGITYLTPLYPRFLYKFQGERAWDRLAKENNVKKKDIKTKNLRITGL